MSEKTILVHGRKVRIIKSRRTTVSLQIRSGQVLIRSPYGVPERDLIAFVKEHEDWICRHLLAEERRQSEREALQKLTDAEKKTLKKRARAVFPAAAAFYADRIGVSYGRISYRFQRTRWGSCSREGNLSFNCLLLLAPEKALESVVVHELCHRKEMNHSRRFYEEVLKAFPEYREWNGWLKKHGPALLGRL